MSWASEMGHRPTRNSQRFHSASLFGDVIHEAGLFQRNILETAVNVASSIASSTAVLPAGVEIRAPALSEAARVLTPEALSFVAKLHRAFESRRQDLLALRAARQREFDAGKFPDFIPETAPLRAREWTIARQPNDLLDRRVEITGPTDRKMVIFFHNAKELLARDAGPYFYLPKMESHLEARLWNDIFKFAQKELGVPQGSIKATALIETVVAAFEMDEILWELREHSAGLNIGRWDYIFSCIKKFRANRGFCLADRAQVTMTAPFMRAYALLLVKTCHRRGAPAMGGMAAQIPIKNDPAANEAALAKVREDKLREVTDGCDGTWVAHPGLVSIAKAVFDEHMPRPNQYEKQRPDVLVAARDLLDFRPEGPITEPGLRNNISVGIQYLGAWLAGNGCVPVFNLMEDAATAEISRSQIWQWIRSPKGELQDGRKVTQELFRKLLAEELPKVKTYLGEEAWNAGKYEEGAKLFDRITTDDRYVEFLTLPAYDYVD